MAATPRLALPYPVASDTVDVPRDIKALSDKLDRLLVPVVNTLPASPSDGDEVYYNVPAIPGARWHLKYEASSAKWWYLGGYTYAAADAGTETRGPGGAIHPTFIALSPARTIAVPLPGVYDITVQAMFWNVATPNNTVRIRPFLNDMGTGLSSMDTAQTLTTLSRVAPVVSDDARDRPRGGQRRARLLAVAQRPAALRAQANLDRADLRHPLEGAPHDRRLSLIAAIANDPHMNERVRACATQQAHLGAATIEDPAAWTITNRYLWASSPTWGEKWDYAVETHPTTPDEPPYFSPARTRRHHRRGHSRHRSVARVVALPVLGLRRAQLDRSSAPEGRLHRRLTGV
jgi:hypothetical protein